MLSLLNYQFLADWQKPQKSRESRKGHVRDSHQTRNMTIKDDLLPEEQSWGFYFCLYPFGRPIHGGFIVLPRYIGIKEAG